MKITKKQHFTHFITAFRYVFRSSAWLTIINFILTFVQSFFPLIIIYFVKELIDVVGLAINSSDKAQAIVEIKWSIFYLGISFLINALANSVSQYIREYQAQLFSDYMYDKLHRKAVSLNLEFFENPDYHDMFFRALQDSPQRPLKIVNNLFFSVQYITAIIILSAYLISLHWVVSVVLLVATVPTAILRLYFSDKMYNWEKSQTQNERKAFYFSRILTNEVFAKELRLFRLQDYFINNFTQLRKSLREGKLQIIKQKSVFESLLQVFSAGVLFSAYAFIAFRAVFGLLSIGSLVLFYLALQKGMSYFRDLLLSISSLYEDNLYISNLSSFLNLENRKKAEGRNTYFPKDLKEGIVIKDLSFAYPNSTRQALKDINMHIKVGTTVAIVGDNGAGKTTLVKLLCHLYEADKGNIFIDGTPLNTINDEDIRAHISIMFQDYVLYHLRAVENIGFGDIEHLNDTERIKQSAEKAGIHDFINKLRDGYDTVLGKMFNDSEELSIGEWQKLAMARAFFKDAPVIILDEPSSSLDAKTEYEIFKQFKQISKGKTSIIISHRFSTVKMADYIYVMEKERITEEGTHEELIHKGGKYAAMYQMQASNYQ